jgi:hypothetical protein
MGVNMWTLWLKEGDRWIESSVEFESREDVIAAAKLLASWFAFDQVFIQEGYSPVVPLESVK